MTTTTDTTPFATFADRWGEVTVLIPLAGPPADRTAFIDAILDELELEEPRSMGATYLDPAIDGEGVAPDANFHRDLREAQALMIQARSKLNTIVGGGYADHDSQVGGCAIHLADELNRMIAQVQAAEEEPADYLRASLLRGPRS